MSLAYGSSGTVVNVVPPPLTGQGSPVGKNLGSLVAGQQYLDQSVSPANLWSYVGNSNWSLVASGSGAIQSVLGTTNQITATTASNITTLSIPSTFIAPGSIASTTTLTGGTGVTATTGNVTATAGNLVVTAAGDGIVTTPVIGTTGSTPITANGRVVSATFSGVSIAAGATEALVIDNSSITSSSQIGLVSWSGATTSSALSLQSVVNDGTGHTSTFTFTNGTGATTSTANITITYVLLN